MQTTKEDDLISISDLIVIIIKHFKLWLTLFIIGTISSITLGVLHKDSYEYSVAISGPTYIENGEIRNVIANSILQKFLNVYFNQFQLENRHDFSQKLKLDTEKMQISAKANKSQQAQFSESVEQFTHYVTNQEGYQSRIKNWTTNIKFNIERLNQQNTRYADYVKSFQDNMGKLTSNSDLSNLNGQVLLNNLSNTIINYQNSILSNNLRIQNYQSQLQSLQSDVSTFGGVTVSLAPVGLTTSVIIALGIMLSLILACAVVFIIAFCRNTKKEICDKLNQNT
ncbi:hypothetical protein [Facilibium subflavum]|uniref:hypothetical protein n=1 Tax=Facilibium subflavum TaxID=2219058 RepID=UPI000E64B583|nr:hypothetical protein [Facilibium subflavum]